MRPLLILILALSSVSLARGQASKPASSPATRFGVVDVVIDTKGQSLGAYQFEFKAETGHVTLVGIEGGQAEPFKTPPYYDPAALGEGRVIIAAFSTETGLPRGATRVARLHVMIDGLAESESPKYVTTLNVAADGEGKSIPGATLTVR
jgi:hypothetical protein